jgi:hypothetical protein
MAFIFRSRFIEAWSEFHPQQSCAPIQQNELFARLAHHVGGGSGRTTPEGHAAQVARAVERMRSRIADRKLGICCEPQRARPATLAQLRTARRCHTRGPTRLRASRAA